MKKFALIISVLGHPLLLGTLYVVVMGNHHLPKNTALVLSVLVIGLITLPITIHNLIRLKKGDYSNFDVSDQNQRKGFYPFALTLFFLLFLCFLYLKFPIIVIFQTSIFFVMLLLMAITNIKIKASLHTAVAFYIGLGILKISFMSGLFLVILALAVGWSRMVLNRHSFSEIAIGALMGVLFGTISILI
jgi:hypothetical protein